MRHLPAAVLALIVAVLTGCGGGDPTTTSGAATATAPPKASVTRTADPALTTQLLDAANNGDAARVKALLARGAVPDDAVAQAVVFGEQDDPTLIEALLAAGLDKDYATDVTPGHSLLMWTAEAGHPRMAEALIDAGADLDKVDDYGDPAVSVAAFHGKLDLVELLVAHGAELGLRGYSDRTAAGHARSQGHDAVADYLVSIGAPE